MSDASGFGLFLWRFRQLDIASAKLSSVVQQLLEMWLLARTFEPLLAG
jgi:hypothetical protein